MGAWPGVPFQTSRDGRDASVSHVGSTAFCNVQQSPRRGLFVGLCAQQTLFCRLENERALLVPQCCARLGTVLRSTPVRECAAWTGCLEG